MDHEDRHRPSLNATLQGLAEARNETDFLKQRYRHVKT